MLSLWQFHIDHEESTCLVNIYLPLFKSISFLFCPLKVMAFSATYSSSLLEDLEPLMKRPQRVMLCEEGPALAAVAQLYCLVPEGPANHLQPPAEQQQNPGPSELPQQPTPGIQQQQQQGQQGQQQQGQAFAVGHGSNAGSGQASGSCSDVFLAKVAKLVELLGSVPFHQVRIHLFFC
jgi:hypothetical protein